MKLKPFGWGGVTREWGYTLLLLVSHLEGLVSDEEQIESALRGPRAKRLQKVQDALDMLQEAVDMGDEYEEQG